MAEDPSGPRTDMTPLFEMVLAHVPPPDVDDGPFRLLVTTIAADPYLGRILTGRVTSGTVVPNQSVKALARDGSTVEQGRISKVLAFRGLARVPVERAEPATSSPLPV